MPDDPDPIPFGTAGTIQWVTELHFGPAGKDKHYQYGVKWDNGRTLSVVTPPDQITLDIPKP